MEAVKHLYQISKENFSALPRTIQPFSNIVRLYAFVFSSIVEGLPYLHFEGNTAEAAMERRGKPINQALVGSGAEAVELVLMEDSLFFHLFKYASVVKGAADLELELPDGMTANDLKKMLAPLSKPPRGVARH